VAAPSSSKRNHHRPQQHPLQHSLSIDQSTDSAVPPRNNVKNLKLEIARGNFTAVQTANNHNYNKNLKFSFARGQNNSNNDNCSAVQNGTTIVHAHIST